MSYNVNLACGCRVYVASHPTTGVVHTQIIEQRATDCGVRSHDVGVRIPLWEVLPYERDEQLAVRREKPWQMKSLPDRAAVNAGDRRE